MAVLWSSTQGDINVPAIQKDGSIVIPVTGIDGITAVGQAVLTAADVAALQQIIAPSSTILSAAATQAISELTSASDAADIVAALQAT